MQTHERRIPHVCQHLLVPRSPIVAIGLALLTKETYSSLFIGIVVGALLATDFSPIGALDTIINDGLTAAIADNAGIFLFLVILGVMVALVNATGGSAAFGRWAASHIHSKAGALLATFALGVLIFIDDYFNCLTVGSVMTPVTDSQRISRVKLAYLIDATAAPICMIAPISPVGGRRLLASPRSSTPACPAFSFSSRPFPITSTLCSPSCLSSPWSFSVWTTVPWPRQSSRLPRPATSAR